MERSNLLHKMPTITLNKKEFEKLVGKTLPIEKLKDRISMLGTDLESVTAKEIIVEVFPDRPDMLSEQGFARAFSSFIGKKPGLRTYSVKKSNEKVIIDSSVKQVRPYTACAIVKNLKLDNERIKQIIQLQEKLHVTFGRNRRRAAIGIYPLDKIKTPITYKALPPEKIKFRPLDYKQHLTGAEILKVHPTGKEYAHLLENTKLYPIFIDAADKILSMPPIINSDEIGRVTEKTRDVFIECSGFNLNILKQCLNIIVTALADMNGAIYSMDLMYSKKETTPDLRPWKLKINPNYVNKILGLNLSQADIKKYARMMTLDYSNGNALIPAYRTDIIHEIDVIEDIAIAYGYENFEEEIPKISTIASQDPKEKLKEQITNFLVGLSLLETSTYDLTNINDHNKKTLLEESSVELGNALNQDYNIVRTIITPSLLKVLSENKHNDYPQRIFEIATTFEKGESETNVIEQEHLSIALSHSKTNFTEIMKIVNSLFKVLNIKYSIHEKDYKFLIPGRSAEIKINNFSIGLIGEIHPEVLNNWGLDTPVAVVEIDIDDLIKCLK